MGCILYEGIVLIFMMDKNAFLWIIFGVLIGFVGGAGLLFDVVPALVSQEGGCSGGVVDSGFSVYYLFPARCINCEKNTPPTCDGCEGFYNAPLLSLVSSELGVPVRFLVSDSVSDASIFVATGSQGFLGSAKSKTAIAQTVCATTGDASACSVVEGQLSSLKECLLGYGVSPDSVIYHYGEDCPHCEAMSPYVRELENLSYDDAPYSVKWVLDEDEAGRRMLTDCLGGLVDINFVPQVICPANARTKTGAVRLSELRDFADECVEASLEL